MSLPSLAAGEAGNAIGAEEEQARLAQAAADAVATTYAAGLDLDDPRGAGLAFAAITDAALTLPLPAGGRTQARLAGLAAVAAVDVTLGRLFEAHTDALAILAELGQPERAAGRRWGVWAAEGPQSTAQVKADGLLRGDKPWCSGATLCTHALATASGAAGQSLHAVELDPEHAVPQLGSWQAIGLAGSSTERVTFVDAPTTEVGKPGEYLTRPGFWHGAIGVAAVWWGAALGIAAPLYAAAAEDRAPVHALAHLGAIEGTLQAGAALLREAAAAIDSHPSSVGEQRALTLRAVIEAAAVQVIDRVGRALGPAPLCQDRAHARRVADLTVYVRQSHAERDLERIGLLAAGKP